LKIFNTEKKINFGRDIVQNPEQFIFSLTRYCRDYLRFIPVSSWIAGDSGHMDIPACGRPDYHKICLSINKQSVMKLNKTFRQLIFVNTFTKR